MTPSEVMAPAGSSDRRSSTGILSPCCQRRRCSSSRPVGALFTESAGGVSFIGASGWMKSRFIVRSAVASVYNASPE
jgi:hypothetical protein